MNPIYHYSQFTLNIFYMFKYYSHNQLPLISMNKIYIFLSIGRYILINIYTFSVHKINKFKNHQSVISTCSNKYINYSSVISC